MAAFVDFAYYVGTFLGSAIPTGSFDQYALRASKAVDFHTFERASAIVTDATDTAMIDKIRLATCAVAEVLYNADQQPSGAISSERVGDHSVNYAVPSETLFTSNAKVSNAMREYLSFTGLMFRGFE